MKGIFVDESVNARFKEYGTQRAWKRVNEPVFRDIPTGMESEIPFLTKP